MIKTTVMKEFSGVRQQNGFIDVSLVAFLLTFVGLGEFRDKAVKFGVKLNYATTHHQPKYIHHHPPPLTTSQNISTTTHHQPKPFL